MYYSIEFTIMDTALLDILYFLVISRSEPLVIFKVCFLTSADFRISIRNLIKL